MYDHHFEGFAGDAARGGDFIHLDSRVGTKKWYDFGDIPYDRNTVVHEAAHTLRYDHDEGSDEISAIKHCYEPGP